MWVIFAVLNPFADAARSLFSKKASLNIDSLIVSWFNNLIPFIIFAPLLFFIELKFEYEFLEALFISGFINIAAAILYHRSISKGDISQVIPMLSFTPLYLLIMSPLIVGEFPDMRGIAGILLIVGGSYLLNINLKQKNYFAPIKSLFVNKGTLYMMIVAFLYSISANYDKIGIASSSVIQYIVFINFFVSAGTTFFLFYRKKFSAGSIKLEWKNLLMVGLITASGFIFHMMALSLTLVVYVIALKRTSGMLSVAIGYIFLDEKHTRERLIGSFIMFCGVLLIIF
jgi:drug/metabolite transporter (DMT)-like permease